MDSQIMHAFNVLRSAMTLPASSSRTRRGPTTRSATAATAKELAELHAIRLLIQEAVELLIKARSAMANIFEGPRGTSFRCHNCDNIAPELLILRSCQHRMCNRCLQSTFDALVVGQVQRISPLLPATLRQPPPVITEDYLKKLAATNVKVKLHCPLCSDDVKVPPIRAQMYSDLLAIAGACVHIPDDLDSSPDRASIASYF